MAKAKTTEKDKTAETEPLVQPAPAAQVPATTPKERWQDFEAGLKQREGDFVALLPGNVDPGKFNACAVAAVQQNPELLDCDARSLFTALKKSAQDGILPDGREGVITAYNTKVSKRGEPDRWAKMAQWNPMCHGLRKRARELEKMLIDAQVVYANDRLVWVQGDDPKIEHYPPLLGTPRGAGIGAYAIFKHEDGTVLAREVMAKDEIEKVREQSKAKDSLMWTTFWTEGWRKTVIRRGIKSVPVHESLAEVVRREDENFDFSNQDGGGSAAPAIEGVMTPPRPRESDFQRQPQHAAEPPKPVAKDEPKGPDGRPEPPPIGEPAATPPEAEPEPQKPVQEAQVPADPVDDEEPEPSEAYMKACNMFDETAEKMFDVPDLDAFKRGGRNTIDELQGITDDERDLLRARFTTMVLVEQKRRGKKGRG